MRTTRKLFGVGFAAFVLQLSSHAADIAWGTATTIVNSTDIKSTGVTGLAGADFGRTNGTTTIVNNGAGETGGVDVEFKSMNGNQTATLSNGVTVSSAFTSFNVAAGNSVPAGNYKSVLGRHMGQYGGSPTIALSDLVDGTQYQIQVFAAGGDANTVNIGGGPGLAVGGGGGANGFGQYAVGTFTATGTSQVITISGGEPVMNALTIGVIPGADTAPPDWIAGWPQAAQRTPTSLAVRARSNETGTAYYVVLASGAAAPTAAQVKAGTDSAGTPAIKGGSIPVTAHAEATAPVTGLTTGSGYDVYFVAEDGVPNLQASPSLAGVAPLVSGTSDTFSNLSATLWGTGFPGTTQTGTAPSKTVHFVGTTTGIEFDVTFTTTSGNLQLRAVGGTNADPRDYLADSGGDRNWFEGPLTITVDNFTGADPADVAFQLLEISGQRLVTNHVDFVSNATPPTAKSLGTPSAWGTLFTDLPLDAAAANLAGGSYTATLAWVNIDPESSGLFKDLSFKVRLGSNGDFTDWAASFLPTVIGQPADDDDGDGLTNDEERIFGLNPISGSSVNPITVPLDSSTGTFSFTRRYPSLTGLAYKVWYSTDLTGWQVDPDAVLTPGAVVNLVQTVAVELGPDLLDEPKLFFRLGAEKPVPLPPLLSATFENDNGGFTVSTVGGTAWEWGTPNSPDQSGGAVTSGAGNSAKCWATNLTGGYAANTDTFLRSPVIDLTAVSGAALTFSKSIDSATGHMIVVNVIDDTTDAVIANIIPAAEDANLTNSPWQVAGPVPIPGAALGQAVRIEWRFAGNGDATYNGVYIDNVTVTRTP